MLPLKPRLVDGGHAAHAELADAVREAVLRAHGFEEGVPSVGDRRCVKERFVEGEQLAAATGFDAVDDCLILRGGHLRVVGDIWEAHFGGV